MKKNHTLLSASVLAIVYLSSIASPSFAATANNSLSGNILTITSSVRQEDIDLGNNNTCGNQGGVVSWHIVTGFFKDNGDAVEYFTLSPGGYSTPTGSYPLPTSGPITFSYSDDISAAITQGATALSSQIVLQSVLGDCYFQEPSQNIPFSALPQTSYTHPTFFPFSGNNNLLSGETYIAEGSFYDTESSTYSATVNYGDGSATQPLTLIGTHFNLNHQYNIPGDYEVRVNVIDGNNSQGIGYQPIFIRRPLTALSPATVYVSKGLLNLGVKLDLRAEIYKDNDLITSGELQSVNPGILATAFNIPFDNFSSTEIPVGTTLKLKIYERNACSGSMLNSGTATLHYNNAMSDNRFIPTLGALTPTYHLLDGFALGTNTGTSQKTVAVAAGARCSNYKSFGTWSITL